MLPVALLVYSGAIADPTAEHHGEDHLKDLNVKDESSLIQREYSSTCNVITADESRDLDKCIFNLIPTMMTATTKAARPMT